jgi:Tfp pilus assembly protein PilX
MTHQDGRLSKKRSIFLLWQRLESNSRAPLPGLARRNFVSEVALPEGFLASSASEGPDSIGLTQIQQAVRASAGAGAAAAAAGPGGSVVISQGSQQRGRVEQYVAPPMQSADLLNIGSDAVTVQVK